VAFAVPGVTQEIDSPVPTKWPRRSIFAILLALYTLTVVRLAWYGDDWLITLRTALNAHAGNGLVFNVGERVAGYTHPLWLMVILVVGSVTGSWVYAVVIVNGALAVMAAALLLWRTRTAAAMVFVGLVLITSNVVTVWSTGGLEGPLGALLIVALVALVPRQSPRPLRSVLWGVLIAAVALTRLDAVILVAPLVGLVMWSHRANRRHVGLMAAGALAPLAAWSLFAWVYYGSILPNTFAAKTNIDIPRSELFGQGLFYLRYSLDYDSVIWVPLLAALVAVLGTRCSRAAALLTGAGVYLIYVVSVGGDFMAGRFLYLPAIVCLLAIAEASRDLRRPAPKWWKAFFVCAAGLVALVALANRSFALTSDTNSVGIMLRGVVDERAFWVANAGTAVVGEPPVAPAITGMDPTSMQRTAAAWARVKGTVPRTVDVEYAAIGRAGILRGPQVHIIDLCGLTDRFLAQQRFVPVPAEPTPMDPLFLSGPGWRVGHYARPLPDGYIDAVTWADPQLLRDPQQAQQLRQLWQSITP